VVDVVFLSILSLTISFLLVGFYYFGMSLYYINIAERIGERESKAIYIRKKYHVRMYKFGFISAVLGAIAVTVKGYYYFLFLFGIWALVLLGFWIFFAKILKETEELNNGSPN
jgi:hypothetical protein